MIYLPEHLYINYDSSSPLNPKLEIPLTLLLAPSPRVLAYLARHGRSPITMTLTTVQEVTSPESKNEVFVPPPPVLITPCDPWPRPYVLEDGLRKVAPYHFTYNTYCKERWRGRELLDIFATEFRDRPQAYYVSYSSQSM